MTPSAPAETSPCPDLMNLNIQNRPEAFKKYMYESMLRGRESSHTHAIGFKLDGIEDSLRKEIDSLVSFREELDILRGFIFDELNNYPSPLPRANFDRPNTPVEASEDLFDRTQPFYKNVVLPAVLDDVNFHMSEINVLISLMCQILHDMDEPTHEMAVKPPQLLTRRHFATYVKSLHTEKPRIVIPPKVSSRPPPTYSYLYDLTRSINNVLDVGGFRHYVEGTSCNPDNFLKEAWRKGLANKEPPDPNFQCWWRASSGYGSGESDFNFDYCSLSPVHYQNYLSDNTVISNFESNGESGHPDFYPDYQTSVDWTSSMMTNGPEGLGKSIVPLFGEVVVPDFNFKWELSTSAQQEHRFTPSNGVHGVRTAAVCGGLTIPTAVPSPPCSGVGIGGVIGRIMARSAEKARSRRLRYLILMVRGHAVHRMAGRRRPKKKKTPPSKKAKRPRASSADEDLKSAFDKGIIGRAQSIVYNTASRASSFLLNRAVRPVFDFFNTNVWYSVLDLLQGLDRIGPDPNDPHNQHQLPEFVLRNRILTMFFSPMTCPLLNRERPVTGVELGTLPHEISCIEATRPNPILEAAERLLFDVVPFLLADINLLAQSDRVALQHMQLLRSKIDALCEPYLNSIKEQRGSVLSMSGTNWAAKYKGVSTVDRKNAQTKIKARLNALLSCLGEDKNSANNLPDDEALDSEEVKTAITCLPRMFAVESELVSTENQIEKLLSSSVAIGKTMLSQTGVPKSAWYKAEGTPAGSRIVYEGESQAESSADDPVCKPISMKIRLQNPFDLSKMPVDSKVPVRAEMDQWDARDVMNALQRIVKGKARDWLTSLISADATDWNAEIDDFVRRIELLIGLVASKSIVTDAGYPIQFPESVVKHLLTACDSNLLRALMRDWALCVATQRHLGRACKNLIFKIRVAESELIFLNKSFETGPTARDGAAAKEEELIRSEVKAKFDAMSKALQEMNWSETGTRLQLFQTTIHPQVPTPEELEQKAQIDERLRQLWGWSNNGTL
ncbi:hypothetical protein TrST_g8543 [Triparma strigata]|uniref:Uncharacterized protein n=1 Tax=Triparma strigata TaxID=1606541 RepID=A0A9W7EIR7_9STRA|nr:hypothetical protein TrST_g8543 [Triparma strigata]